jgi:hypothetical protein
MNRPARITQAEIARALRAARDAVPGGRVDIRPDGTITIHLPDEAEDDRPPAQPLDDEIEIVL